MNKVNIWIEINSNNETITDEVCKIVDPYAAEEDIIGDNKLDNTVVRDMSSKLMITGGGLCGRACIYSANSNAR